MFWLFANFVCGIIAVVVFLYMFREEPELREFRVRDLAFMFIAVVLGFGSLALLALMSVMIVFTDPDAFGDFRIRNPFTPREKE